MDFKKKCNTCANQGTFQDGSPGCVKFKIKVDLNKDFCSWHADKDIPHCKFCNETKNLVIINFNDENTILVCQEHAGAFNTCQTCEFIHQCGFQQDNSEPQFVMKSIYQGNIVMQQQVRNPNLIKKHCPSCHCSHSDESMCLKGTEFDCPNWSLRTELLQ